MAVSRVPWRRSLLLRIVAVGVLIALVAIAAATWATVRATTVAVRDAQQNSLHTEASIYDTLVGYAASHPSWAGAGTVVQKLAREADRQVTVTDTSGRVLVDSAGADAARSPAGARATLDPLAVDPVLLAGADDGTDQSPVDVGPVACPSGSSSCGRRVVGPPAPMDGRVVAVGRTSDSPLTAESFPKTQPRRWHRVVQQVDACLARAGLPRAEGLTPAFGVVVRESGRQAAVARCADHARRSWYAGQVAPPALLFVSGEAGSAEVFWDLSRDSKVRIVLLAGGVALVVLTICLLFGGSVVRPIRRMAVAAQRAGDGDLDARVPDRRRDEIGEVARAFNRMADRRQQLEGARRRMVSDVSHELRTPLANVRGWLEAVQDGLAEPDARLVASLHEETLHLQRLVDDLHDLSVGDAGEMRLDPVEVEVAVFLEQVADGFHGAAGSVGVVLRVEAEPGAAVVADPVRIRQAVGNLVANAIRHTPPGGEIVLRGGDGVLEVADTGAGIPAADLPHVFERFRRADASRSRATGGSGLGLAIVRQIVEAHGGAVTIESDVGVGTRVRITLPGS
ncbi:HAMP domain-containing sensor histidine kinase [Nocardioides sp. CN2-186]|uniref:sensor histidine kinase n=1 Tax=Nocardioides tweenelious TaxID=3156607 RepID=UPI0032B51E7A